MTVGDRLAGRLVSPGTDAVAIITAGTPARIAAEKASRPPFCRVDQGSVVAATLSVLPLAPPRPGKCLTTGTTPAASRPRAKAVPSAAATDSTGLNERVPSGLVELGPGRP